MPDIMTGELYAVVYAVCVKTCHLFAYDGLDCFALPCDVIYKIWYIYSDFCGTRSFHRAGNLCLWT